MTMAFCMAVFYQQRFFFFFARTLCVTLFLIDSVWCANAIHQSIFYRFKLLNDKKNTAIKRWIKLSIIIYIVMFVAGFAPPIFSPYINFNITIILIILLIWKSYILYCTFGFVKTWSGILLLENAGNLFSGIMQTFE